MSCGCGNNTTPTPAPAPSSPSYSQPTGGSPCPNSHCDSHFEGLAKANGFNLLGLIGKCFRILAGNVRGFVVNDPDGTSYVTNQVSIDIPENASYQKNADGSVALDPSTQLPIKSAPPPFFWLVGRAADFWRAIVGRSGQRQTLVWNGSQWVIEDERDWSGNRPASDFPQFGTPCGIEMLAIRTFEEAFTSECGTPGTRMMSQVGRIGYAPGIVGEIKSFAGPVESIPPGYMACNGAAISKTTWPALFAVIGYAWGGSGDSFQVPDLRGRFLRGLDAASGRDASSSRSLGSYQEDSVIQHRHGATFSQTDSPSANFQLNLGTAAAPEEGVSQVSVYSQSGTLGNQVLSATVSGIGVSGTILDVSGTDKVSVETRPKNAAVNFIIFAGCSSNG